MMWLTLTSVWIILEVVEDDDLTPPLPPKKLSNGDENPIEIGLFNQFQFTISTKIIDELPVKLQQRDFKLLSTLKPSEEKTYTYQVRPNERGEYHFGDLNIYVSSKIGMISKRYIFDSNTIVPTYPSFKQLRKFELLNINQNSLINV